LLGHKNIQHRVRYSSSPPNTLLLPVDEVHACASLADIAFRLGYALNRAGADAQRLADLQYARAPAPA
jgi:hypothetical protein